MTIPRFDVTTSYDNEHHAVALACPNCQNVYLSHVCVEIFERDREDAEHGLHVRINRTFAKMDTDIEANPSPRRSGLSIYFECEGCGHPSVLDIQQHKGTTYLNHDMTIGRIPE